MRHGQRDLYYGRQPPLTSTRSNCRKHYAHAHRPPDPSLEYTFIQEGCGILECWNHADDPQASIARARVAPGTATRWHALKGVVERYLVISGRGRVELGDATGEEVHPGSVVVIPAGVRQRIHNTGSEELLFYAICTPRFTADCYATLE